MGLLLLLRGFELRGRRAAGGFADELAALGDAAERGSMSVKCWIWKGWGRRESDIPAAVVAHGGVLGFYCVDIGGNMKDVRCRTRMAGLRASNGGKVPRLHAANRIWSLDIALKASPYHQLVLSADRATASRGIWGCMLIQI